ncbi:HNH endonuclease [Actinocorallia sp. A-T 12471]|uniref:HNH endonuclease n=1 Tax=Actinocorallia sp. A-T 12471 TaxID=3089813 RepID=UPI0029D1D211|nr:HNH endonuclease [Actinocorallia sp. A-T 12471]MDX6744711.1 HNH endonuclease [Actinocorallia sp. A-T 12471]
MLETIAEFDELGQAGFLALYGYPAARRYLLIHDGKEHDSKAIAGVAHNYEYGNALTWQEFSGGKDGVARWLSDLGFTVRAVPNPNLSWDELVLVCDLVVKNSWKGFDATNPQVVELSKLLNLAPIRPAEARGETFRNPNGVARETFELATHHPAYTGKPTSGGALDLKVIEALLARPNEMAQSAALLRQGLLSGDLTGDVPADDDDEEFNAPEGRLLLRRHRARERSPKLRQRKIDSVLKAGGTLACEACGFDFEKTYGPRSADYVECHHVIPLHRAGEGATKLSHLALICANCHRMIHCSAPWSTPEELSQLMKDSHVNQDHR